MARVPSALTWPNLAISIGSVGTPALLASLVPRGGAVVWGEGYWQRQPDPPLLTALGADRDELASLEGMLARGAAAGLVPGRPVTSSQADWDAYEDAWADNGERFAAGHAGEPGPESSWNGSGPGAGATVSTPEPVDY